MSDPITQTILNRHLDPCLDMLAQVIERCPAELWNLPSPGAPIWQHIYHTLVGPDFWFRADPATPFEFLTFGKDVSPDLDKPSADWLTPDELKAYIQITQRKCREFIEMGRLEETSTLTDVFTRLDLVLMQIRHIQHHVGYCNGILRAHGIAGAPWLGYGE